MTLTLAFRPRLALEGGDGRAAGARAAVWLTQAVELALEALAARGELGVAR